MERLIKEELRRFYTVFLSYTKVVIGGMFAALVISAIWSLASVYPQQSLTVVALLVFSFIVIFLLNYLIPIRVQLKPEDKSDSTLASFGLTPHDATQLGSFGAVAFLLGSMKDVVKAESQISYNLEIVISETDGTQSKFLLSEKDLLLLVEDSKVLITLAFSCLPFKKYVELDREIQAALREQPLSKFMLGLWDITEEILKTETGQVILTQLLEKERISSIIGRYIVKRNLAHLSEEKATTSAHKTKPTIEAALKI